jgi:hypothetical protein
MLVACLSERAEALAEMGVTSEDGQISPGPSKYGLSGSASVSRGNTGYVQSNFVTLFIGTQLRTRVSLSKSRLSISSEHSKNEIRNMYGISSTGRRAYFSLEQFLVMPMQFYGFGTKRGRASIECRYICTA